MALNMELKKGVEHKAASLKKARYFSKKITINYFDNLYFDTFNLREEGKNNPGISLNSLPHYSTKKMHGKNLMDSNIAI